MVNKKVAVIGAGLAGLTTAYRLASKGVEVMLFEARNRVGGRVFTIEMLNAQNELSQIELGGQNITDGGVAANLINLAKELNLEIKEKAIKLKGAIYYQNEYIDVDSLNLGKLYNKNKLDELAEKSHNMGELIEGLCVNDPIIKQELITRLTAYEGVNVYQQSIYHNIDTLEATLLGGVSKFHEEYEHEENELITSSIVGGNARLPLALKKSLDQKLFCNKILSKLEMVNESGLNIYFTDNSSYQFDFVVLAVPVSTYKNIDLSHSGISPEKIFEMSQIQYGQNYKIAGMFNLKTRNKYRFVLAKEGISFFNFDETIPMLYMNNAVSNIGQYAEICARGLSNDFKLKKSAPLPAIDANFKQYNHPVTHAWGEDPFALGSYSGYSISISDKLDKKERHQNGEYKSLFSPINGKLFFAGEHTTILDCIATMEAAVESGERIAKAILLELEI